MNASVPDLAALLTRAAPPMNRATRRARATSNRAASRAALAEVRAAVSAEAVAQYRRDRRAVAGLPEPKLQSTPAPVAAPTPYALAILGGLTRTGRHVYGGTVAAAEKARRRVANRTARSARAMNRRTA